MCCSLRRLDPTKDREVYQQVFGWEADYPRWLRDAEKACGVGLDEWLGLGQLERRADIAVYDPELAAMFSIHFDRGPKIFEAHVWAKRRTSLATLVEAADQLISSATNHLGMRAFYVWIAKRNVPIKRLCDRIGCVADGTMIDGESHGRPIEWQRMTWINPHG